MPANNRVYSIKINGISESIDIVDSLLGKLNELEKKINLFQRLSMSPLQVLMLIKPLGALMPTGFKQYLNCIFIHCMDEGRVHTTLFHYL